MKIHAGVVVIALAGLAACAAHPRPCPPAYATAAVAEDGTITLQAVDPGLDATPRPRLTYAKDHPHYAQIRAHIGTIAPDTEKLVEAWPAVTCADSQ